MRVYAHNQISELLGPGYGLSITAENRDDVQNALDTDPDSTLTVRAGMFIQRDEAGRIAIYSNSFGGYSGGGTRLVAVIR